MWRNLEHVFSGITRRALAQSRKKLCADFSPLRVEDCRRRAIAKAFHVRHHVVECFIHILVEKGRFKLKTGEPHRDYQHTSNLDAIPLLSIEPKWNALGTHCGLRLLKDLSKICDLCKKPDNVFVGWEEPSAPRGGVGIDRYSRT